MPKDEFTLEEIGDAWAKAKKEYLFYKAKGLMEYAGMERLNNGLSELFDYPNPFIDGEFDSFEIDNEIAQITVSKKTEISSREFLLKQQKIQTLRKRLQKIGHHNNKFVQDLKLQISKLEKA